MQKIIVLLLTLLMLLSIAACGAPSVEDNVEDQRDEVNGDNIAGSDFGDLEFLPQPEDTDKDNASDTQKPEQDKTPVDDDKDDTSSEDKNTEQEKDDTTEPDDSDKDDGTTTPPSSDSGNSGSGSGSGGSSDGSTGTTTVNGEVVRQFPAGTDVNTITPDPNKFFERVMIGNDEYLWNGSIWGLVDNTDPPNQDSIIEGDPFSGPPSPFN